MGRMRKNIYENTIRLVGTQTSVQGNIMLSIMQPVFSFSELLIPEILVWIAPLVASAKS